MGERDALGRDVPGGVPSSEGLRRCVSLAPVSGGPGAKRDRPHSLLAWNVHRHRGPKARQAIQAEFKGTLDAEPDAVIIFEPKDWRILYANHGATVLLGTQRTNCSDGPVDFTAEPIASPSEASWRRSCEDRSPVITLETKLRTQKPRAAPIDVSLQLIRIAADRIVAIARDITDRSVRSLNGSFLSRGG